MQSPHRGSYEYYRLNSQKKSTDQPEKAGQAFRKDKFCRQMTQIDHLSQELDHLSSRSFRSISYNDLQDSSLVCSSAQKCQKGLKRNDKHNTSLAIMNVAQFQQSEDLEERERMCSFSSFNKFQPIEESHPSHEDETIEEIKIRTNSNFYNKKEQEKSNTKNKENLQSPLTTRVMSSKNHLFNGVQTTRGKQIEELEAMAKKLNKGETPKSNKPKETAQKQKNEMNGKTSKNLVHVNVKTKTPQNNNLNTKKNLIPKLPESRLASFKSKVIQKKDTPPKKMISVKEKETLILKLMDLKKIIQQNQICSDSSVVVSENLDKVLKVLLG